MTAFWQLLPPTNKRLSSNASNLSAMDSSNPMSLLSMPREIHDIMYKELVFARNIILPSPSDPGLRFPELSRRKYSFELSDERFPWHSHLNLFFCNHQLHPEFLEPLNAAHSTWGYAKLDCMIKDDCLWPTWTIFPASRNPKIRSLDIDLCVWDIMYRSNRNDETPVIL